MGRGCFYAGQRGAGLGEKVALGWPVLADEPDDEVADPGVGVLGEPVGGLADVAGDGDALGCLGGDAIAVGQPADERVARGRLGRAEEGRRAECDGGLWSSMAGGEVAEPLRVAGAPVIRSGKAFSACRLPGRVRSWGCRRRPMRRCRA